MTTERPLVDDSLTSPDATFLGAPGQVPLPVRVQMMATEHWSLLASRNLAWNESFTRAAMFVSTLSFAIVALALIGQASGFGEGFRLFALVVLPVVLFLGLTTLLRLDSANYHDAMCVIGMNRIRAGYLEIAPELERFFVMGTTDDATGIDMTMAVYPNRPWLLNIMGASPTLVAVLNVVLFGAIVSLAIIQLGAAPAIALTVGVAVGALSIVAWIWWVGRMVKRLMAGYQPRFPGAG